MTTMIERVARAIAPNFGPPFDEWHTERDVKRCWGIFGYETQEQLLLAARDAIEAMREPSENMVSVGVFHRMNVSLSRENTWPDDTSNLFSKMIDAALKIFLIP